MPLLRQPSKSIVTSVISTMELTFDEFCSFTSSITKEAADIIISRDPSSIRTSAKPDGTLVTNSDCDIEILIRSRIEEKFPTHCITGEEYDDKIKSSSYTWIIDPIDGTTSYHFGVPFFGILVGLLKDGIPLFGCMRLPVLNLVLVGDGSQCMIDGSQCKVKKFDGFERALILTSDDIRMSSSVYSESWSLLRESGATFRTWGDCYGYYLLCVGKADAMFDLDLKPCDILPIIPIVKGAGARIIDFGKNEASNIAACVPELGDKISGLFANK
jgi:fructose-1,6-bisphosphatase/inositol monophosphatase family enzyme